MEKMRRNRGFKSASGLTFLVETSGNATASLRGLDLNSKKKPSLSLKCMSFHYIEMVLFVFFFFMIRLFFHLYKSGQCFMADTETTAGFSKYLSGIYW